MLVVVGGGLPGCVGVPRASPEEVIYDFIVFSFRIERWTVFSNNSPSLNIPVSPM
jgi:hypothetical protein